MHFARVSLVFIPLYLVGQWEMIRRQPDWTRIGFMWVLALLHMAILVWVFFMSGYIANRHVLPLMALAMPFTALGMIYAADMIGPLLRMRPRTLAFADAAGRVRDRRLPYSVRPYNREFVPVIAATQWIQQHARPGAGVVCNSPYVGYYGSLPTTILGPQAVSLDAALAKGRRACGSTTSCCTSTRTTIGPSGSRRSSGHYRQVGKYPDPTQRPARPQGAGLRSDRCPARRRSAGRPRS